MNSRPMPPERAPRVVLYERRNCHLCEEARAVLDASIGPEAYTRIDIDVDDDLVVRYGFRVPVVSIDGEERLEAPIDATALNRLVGGLRSSSGR